MFLILFRLSRGPFQKYISDATITDLLRITQAGGEMGWRALYKLAANHNWIYRIHPAQPKYNQLS